MTVLQPLLPSGTHDLSETTTFPQIHHLYLLTYAIWLQYIPIRLTHIQVVLEADSAPGFMQGPDTSQGVCSGGE